MITIQQVLQEAWNLNSDANALASDLRDGASEIHSASAALEPQQRALRTLQGEYDLEESRLRSVETAQYAVDKTSKNAPKSVMTAGDAAGRKAQLDAYIAQQSANKETELGRLALYINQKEVEVETLTAKVKDGERQQRAQLVIAELQGKRLEVLGRMLAALSAQPAQHVERGGLAQPPRTLEDMLSQRANAANTTQP